MPSALLIAALVFQPLYDAAIGVPYTSYPGVVTPHRIN
jgi:hypothetical protein